MPSLRFRRAEPSDIPAMTRVRLAVRENALSDPARITPHMYEEHIAGGGRSWVCELDGEIVGFSSAASADASIWALFVAPEREGLGIGTELLDLATQWLFERGAREVRLSTGTGTRAERFYTARGWTRGTMKDALEVFFTLRRDAENARRAAR